MPRLLTNAKVAAAVQQGPRLLGNVGVAATVQAGEARIVTGPLFVLPIAIAAVRVGVVARGACSRVRGLAFPFDDEAVFAKYQDVIL